jgi:hypothetical protein
MRVAIILVSLFTLILNLSGNPRNAGSDVKTSSPPAATQNTQASNPEQSADLAQQWDPTSCYDCEPPYKTEGVFFLGALFAIPISVWVIRRKTRKIESAPTKRYFEI